MGAAMGEQTMKTGKKFAALGLGVAATVASAAVPLASAEAAPMGRLIFAVDRPADQPTLDKVQYFWGGRNYCWYDGGWQGPGWYWCGYAWRRGFGWGGGYGWHSWHGGHGGGGHGGYVGGGHGGGGHGGYASSGHGGGGHGGGGGHSGGGHGGGGHGSGG